MYFLSQNVLFSFVPETCITFRFSYFNNGIPNKKASDLFDYFFSSSQVTTELKKKVNWCHLVLSRRIKTLALR